jgi:Calx-beta domain
MSLYRRTSSLFRLPRPGRASAVVAALLASLLTAGLSAAADPPACTSTWDGGGGSTYMANPDNWSDNHLPGPSDVACVGAGVKVDLWSGYMTVGALRSDSPINMPGGTLTLTGSPGSSSITSTLTVSGSGWLAVDGVLGADRIVQAGGAIVGKGHVSTADFTWNGGSQGGGAGVTQILSGGPGLALGGDGRSLGSKRTLRIDAGAKAVWTSGDFELTDTARLDNAGSFDIRGDQDLTGYGADATILNEEGATISRSSGNGTVGVGYALANEGRLDVATGTVALRTPTPAGGDSNGDVHIADGATLRLEAGQHLTDHSHVTGAGTLVVARDIQELDGAIEASLTVEGGTAHLNSDVTLPRIELRDGVLSGTGTASTPDLHWSTGSLAGTGRTVIVPGGAGLVLETPQPHGMFGRTLEIAPGAQGLWLEGTLVMQDYALLENRGRFELSGDLPGPEACCAVDAHPLIHNAAGAVLLRRSGRGFARIPYAFRNDGRVEATSGTLAFGAVENIDRGTLRGGEWIVQATLQLPADAVQGNAATLVFDGPSSRVQDPAGGDALRNMSVNEEGGSLTVTGGRDLSLPAAARDFENAGTLVVGAQSTLRAGASYRQTGGRTTLSDSTSRLVAPGGALDVSGGRLEGFGTVDGALTNAALVAPGAASGVPGPVPATITVTGDYLQTATGALEAKIGGVAAGTAHDLLDVSGTATLAGDLRLQTLNGFLPSPDDEFDLLRHAAVQGEFDRVNGLSPDSNHSYWPPQYGDHATTLRRATEPQASIGDVTVAEGDSGDGEARVDISLSSPPTRAVHLHWSTADGSATAPTDYEPVVGDVTIPHGATSAAISVPVHADRVHEGDETFHVDLSNPAGASIGTGRGTITITDDDPALDPPPGGGPGPGTDPGSDPGSGGGTPTPPKPVKPPPKPRPKRCVDRLAPLSSVTMPRPPKAKKRRRLTLRGKASDKGCAKLKSVRIAVALKVKAKDRRRCRWLGLKGRFGKRARCDRPVWLKPRGSAKWQLKLRRALARGSYEARSQARDRAGNLERRLRRRGKGGLNAVGFRVR